MAIATEATGTVPDGLLDAALGLPPAARRELADRLTASLHTPAPLSPEWLAEIARRAAAYEAGALPASDWRESLARVEARLRGGP